MLPRRRIVYLVLALTAAGCSDPFALVERQELSAARTRWERAGLSHYRMEVRVGCFCPEALPEFIVIEVRDGAVVAAEVDPSFEIPLDAWPTVSEAFTTLERAAASDTYSAVEAEYDPELGYPTHLRLSCPPDHLDCGYSLHLRNLEPVGPAPPS